MTQMAQMVVDPQMAQMVVYPQMTQMAQIFLGKKGK